MITYMIDIEVKLEPLNWTNIEDVVDNFDSSSKFFDLPHTDDEIDKYVRSAHRSAHFGYGATYNAYEQDGEFIGSGQIYREKKGPVVQLGYMVKKSRRRLGYGGLILEAVEDTAIDSFPNLERLELEINQQNIASRALAESMGYEFLYSRENDEMMIFWKIP